MNDQNIWDEYIAITSQKSEPCRHPMSSWFLTISSCDTEFKLIMKHERTMQTFLSKISKKTVYTSISIFRLTIALWYFCCWVLPSCHLVHCCNCVPVLEQKIQREWKFLQAFKFFFSNVKLSRLIYLLMPIVLNFTSHSQPLPQNCMNVSYKQRCELRKKTILQRYDFNAIVKFLFHNIVARTALGRAHNSTRLNILHFVSHW